MDRAVPIEVRQIKNLNNIARKEHRAVKRITKTRLGLKTFRTASAFLPGIELMHMICKGNIELSFADQSYALAGQIRPV